jgi:hypothetical protein
LLPLDLPVAFAIVSAAATSLILDYHDDVLDKLVLLLLLLRHICSRPACQKGLPPSRPRAHASHRRRDSLSHCLETAPREAKRAGQTMPRSSKPRASCQARAHAHSRAPGLHASRNSPHRRK